MFLKRKPRVLLLDDDPSMQRLVSKILKDEGFKVDVVLTGREAIAAIAKGQYDAMLLDLMMPHEGGLTVIRHLESSDKGKLQRVIVLSGSPESVLGNVRDSVAGIVQKPFEATELIGAVRRITKSE
jgi:DNA-binding response OmpR family regulator